MKIENVDFLFSGMRCAADLERMVKRGEVMNKEFEIIPPEKFYMSGSRKEFRAGVLYYLSIIAKHVAFIACSNANELNNLNNLNNKGSCRCDCSNHSAEK